MYSKRVNLNLELRWLAHNVIVHPLVGVICFSGALLRAVRKGPGQGLIDFGEALHTITAPEASEASE